MSHIETINGTTFEVLGTVGLCGGEEIYEVRTMVDGELAYYEEAGSLKQMESWVQSEIKQCRKELS